MKLFGAFLLLAAFVTVAEGSDEYLKDWERMSAEHDRLISTPAGKDYEERLIAVHNMFWRDVYAQCIADARKEGVAVFRAIAVIDSAGNVTQFLTMPNSTHFSCFTKSMVGKRYPKPPTVPFHERFRIYITRD